MRFWGGQAERPRLRNLGQFFASAGHESQAQDRGKTWPARRPQRSQRRIGRNLCGGPAQRRTARDRDLTGLQSLLLARVLPLSMAKVTIAETLAGMFRTGFGGYFYIIQT
jgi:hypothetical protein